MSEQIGSNGFSTWMYRIVHCSARIEVPLASEAEFPQHCVKTCRFVHNLSFSGLLADLLRAKHAVFQARPYYLSCHSLVLMERASVKAFMYCILSLGMKSIAAQSYNQPAKTGPRAISIHTIRE